MLSILKSLESLSLVKTKWDPIKQKQTKGHNRSQCPSKLQGCFFTSCLVNASLQWPNIETPQPQGQHWFYSSALFGYFKNTFPTSKFKFPSAVASVNPVSKSHPILTLLFSHSISKSLHKPPPRSSRSPSSAFVNNSLSLCYINHLSPALSLEHLDIHNTHSVIQYN